ncbi:zinc ribbon domain-containing protein [Methanobrevibacter sp.]|uniref:zinc ribbon domain-containing protein n=1 Tax=Methanobrevibacter sp. TaxID=66852 RepID=UPI002600252B|nr:zinc ribbon domain-containing protein [Methanobrevibacter sp.]MBR4448436.1 zinc ribbon domain-containing protein [Methanobrevibacter sp.]
MTKNCPKCGKELPDNAKFCMDCGYSMEKTDKGSSNIFSNGNIFIILIALILVVGGIFILTLGSGGNNSSTDAADNAEHVDLTITDVNGWDSDSGKKSYTLYTRAIFNSIPNDLKGYNIKSTYYDSNGTKIGYETETLENVYYDTEFSIGFGYYTTYKLPDPDYVTVEIIKNGKVIDNYTEKIDQSKIDYLN